jgi:hypothetical protein
MLALGGCGGRAATVAPDVASESEWRALRQPRPEPLDGAARVAVGDIAFLGAIDWPFSGSVGASLGISELVVAGLLRRRDVDFVERRRFDAGVAAEKLGARPRTQPPAGVSRSADFIANATWIAAGAAGTSLEIALVDPETGDVAAGARRSVPADADPVRLARIIVEGIMEALDEAGRRPVWSDPLAEVNAGASGGVSPGAVASFLRGLAAEEVWRWEDARRGYSAAATDPDFHEARTALARAARLRLGGTLAES